MNDNFTIAVGGVALVACLVAFWIYLDHPFPYTIVDNQSYQLGGKQYLANNRVVAAAVEQLHAKLSHDNLEYSELYEWLRGKYGPLQYSTRATTTHSSARSDVDVEQIETHPAYVHAATQLLHDELTKGTVNFCVNLDLYVDNIQ